HSNYNFVKIPSYGNNGFLNYLLLTSIKYENLEIIDLIIQDHLSRHKEWVFYYPKVLYRIGRSENFDIFSRFVNFFKWDNIQVVEGAASTGNLDWLETCIRMMYIHVYNLPDLKRYIVRGCARAQVQVPLKYASVEDNDEY